MRPKTRSYTCGLNGTIDYGAGAAIVVGTVSRMRCGGANSAWPENVACSSSARPVLQNGYESSGRVTPIGVGQVPAVHASPDARPD
jgi:hypothetical protein